MFWFSGMIRGAISFALCLQIQSQDKKYITTIGLVIVLITTVTGSMFLKKFVKYTGLSSTENQTTEEKYQINYLDYSNLLHQINVSRN